MIAKIIVEANLQVDAFKDIANIDCNEFYSSEKYKEIIPKIIIEIKMLVENEFEHMVNSFIKKILRLACSEVADAHGNLRTEIPEILLWDFVNSDKSFGNLFTYKNTIQLVSGFYAIAIQQIIATCCEHNQNVYFRIITDYISNKLNINLHYVSNFFDSQKKPYPCDQFAEKLAFHITEKNIDALKKIIRNDILDDSDYQFINKKIEFWIHTIFTCSITHESKIAFYLWGTFIGNLAKKITREEDITEKIKSLNKIYQIKFNICNNHEKPEIIERKYYKDKSLEEKHASVIDLSRYINFRDVHTLINKIFIDYITTPITSHPNKEMMNHQDKIILKLLNTAYKIESGKYESDKYNNINIKEFILDFYINEFNKIIAFSDKTLNTKNIPLLSILHRYIEVFDASAKYRNIRLFTSSLSKIDPAKSNSLGKKI